MAKKKEEAKAKKPAKKPDKKLEKKPEKESKPRKKPGPKKGEGGRPEREFDKKIFENLCMVQCTNKEIEAVLNTDTRTLDKWCKKVYNQSYSEVKNRYSENGKGSLRRMQFRQALKNPTMSIWLGKNWLGQSDKREVESKSEILLVRDPLSVDELEDEFGQ